MSEVLDAAFHPVTSGSFAAEFVSVQLVAAIADRDPAHNMAATIDLDTIVFILLPIHRMS
jgi:hypothetical protein